MITLAVLGLGLYQNLETCGDLKSAYNSEKCCRKSNTKPISPLRHGKQTFDTQPSEDGDYDIVIAGGGTGSLAYAYSLARASHVSGKRLKIKMLDAGRMIHPLLYRCSYSIDGVSKHRYISYNWPAFMDVWLTAYGRWGVGDENSDRMPTNSFLSMPAFLDDQFVARIRKHLDNFRDGIGPLRVEDFPEIEIDLRLTDGTVKFKGPILALLNDAMGDPGMQTFLTTGFPPGGMEDHFYYTAVHNTGDASKTLKYPRGKTLGGSSVVNVGVHYGLTRQYLERLCTMLKDTAWCGAEFERMFTEALVANDCECMKHDSCTQPVLAQCLDEFETPENFLNLIEKMEVATNMPPSRDSSEFILQNDFDLARRFKSTIGVRSHNRWSKAHSTSADTIASMLANGIRVCFVPHKNPLILSEKVLPAELNCGVPETSENSILHIQTGAFITGLTFDEVHGVPRVTGVEYVHEEDQDRPDQNRISRNVNTTCTASNNLYGTGRDNTNDCMNREYGLETRGTLTDEEWHEVKQRTATSTGYLMGRGFDGANGRYMKHQRQIPNERETLPALKKVNLERAKMEVVLGMGAPGTTALLMRSGIADQAESRRLGVEPVANLPVGRMSDNFEFYFAPMPHKPLSTVSLIVGLLNRIAATGMDNFNTTYVGAELSKTQAPGLTIRPRPCSNGRYEQNLHHVGPLPSGVASHLYSAYQSPAPFLLVGGLPVVTDVMLFEMCSSDDARQNTGMLKLYNAHPMGKIEWFNTYSHTPERCQCQFEAIHQWTQIMEETYQVRFESLAYTIRQTSINKFIKNMDENALLGTGTADISQEDLDKYFDDNTNPIIAGYRGADTNMEDFCPLLQTSSSGHHIQGGAIMGPADDDTSVTNSRGKVYNVKNLRIADMSMLPLSPDGNPWVSLYQLSGGIGYFAAMDLLNLSVDDLSFLEERPTNRYF